MCGGASGLRYTLEIPLTSPRHLSCVGITAGGGGLVPELTWGTVVKVQRTGFKVVSVFRWDL